MPDKTQKYRHPDRQGRERARATANTGRPEMEAAVQFSALLGVASPAASTPSSARFAKKQSCSARPQRAGRLRVRAVEVGEASAAAPEEEPSIDFAFVAVSSLGFDHFITTSLTLTRRLLADDAAAAAAGRDAGRAVPDGVRRAEAQRHHDPGIHRPLRAIREPLFWHHSLALHLPVTG